MNRSDLMGLVETTNGWVREHRQAVRVWYLWIAADLCTDDLRTPVN